MLEHERSIPPDGTIGLEHLVVASFGGATALVAVLIPVVVTDGATGDVDVTVDRKVQVADVWLVKTGAAGGAADTIQVKNGANAITDAMDINVADQAVVRAATIDDSQQDIAAGGTLRVTRTKSSAANVACIVYVVAFREA